MVDATTWSDDQHYHRDAARVHQLVGHGWGIVEGLEVTVDTDVRRWLVVRSGVAIDPVGRMLLLPQDTRLEIAAAAGQRCFVTLKYAEQTAHPQSAWDGAEHATRIVESVEVSVELELPAPPTVELARFVASDALRDAVDPSNPQTGEVDLRFRERQLVRPRPDIAIAQLTGLTGDEDQASERHRLGVRFLAREIGQTTAYRARWVGTVSADQPLPHCALLYMTGDRAFTVDARAVLSELPFALDRTDRQAPGPRDTP